MCGIVGGWWGDAQPGLEARAGLALQAMRKRGPDNQTYRILETRRGALCFGHARLSIIDLSDAANQPMVSNCGRYTIAFNGEIYNYRELRAELQAAGRAFHTDSDTEVLLEAWDAWSEGCLPRLTGMFAFCIHDKRDDKLFLARDAFGIKPLMVRYGPRELLFASDPRALFALAGEPPVLDWQTAYEYLIFGNYDYCDRTFFRGVRHLRPGSWLRYDLATGQAEAGDWWRPERIGRSELSFADAAERLREMFIRSVRLHLRSDVPLGSALSGGLDSSAVVCAIRHLEPDVPINTFSFIADDAALSEERWVDRINAAAGGIAHKTTLTGADLAAELEDMIWAQGEPFGSTSIYAQYRVFKLAREHGITVTLDGQGADELLAGYDGYPGQRMLSLAETRGLGAANAFARRWARWPDRSYRLAWMYYAKLTLPDPLYELGFNLLGRDFKPDWMDVGLLREAGVRMFDHRPARSPAMRGRRVIEEMARSLQNRGLPALLRHGDRNSMNFSVESRVPFLTTELAEFLLSLPEDYLISADGCTKSVFRAAMRGIVPDDVLDRRDKKGFATPEKAWLGQIAPQVSGRLDVLGAVPFLRAEPARRRFDAIVAGRAKFSWQAWRWLNFAIWHERMGIRNEA